jgi:flagellar hook-associated protein 3 FlgL
MVQSQITRTQQQLMDVQNQLTTQKRVNQPSDDPGSSAIIQQLQKTLEQRKGYSDNLKSASSHLSEVDSTLGDLSDLLRQAQTIASQNVGTDRTADERESAAEIIKNIFSQVLSIGNKSFQNVYLFAGDRSTDAPFVEEGGGVKFVGSSKTLENRYDENTTLSFMVDGADVFGALSTRVQGSQDLTPAITGSTKLSDLRGATGDGVRLGSISISDGVTSKTIDLSNADTISDVIDRINNAAVGGISADVSADGSGITISSTGSDDITVTDIGGGKTAEDLGILATVSGGTGVSVVGQAVAPRVTGLTPLSALNGGAGIDLSGLTISNGLRSATIDLSAAVTVEDMLNAINGANVGVKAEINSSGTGINILNPIQGTELKISESGGNTATDLGVRSFNTATPLSELNNGKGVKLVTGADLTITAADGTSFDVDLDGATTIQDVIDAINTAAGTAGVAVSASFVATGNGIELTDGTVGAATFKVNNANFSTAAKDLGIDGNAVAGVITGTDVNPVNATGIFANLGELRDALQTNDQTKITEAATALQEDLNRSIRVRGEVGARVQEFESRSEKLDDQNLATTALLSSIQDVDFTEAVSRFQTLQTAMQATLQASAMTMRLSLMDFLS